MLKNNRDRTKSLDQIDFILMKNSQYAFDFDVTTQKTDQGKIKVFVGIDKVRKQEEGFDCDTINQSQPYCLGLKKYNKGKSFLDKVNEL